MPSRPGPTLPRRTAATAVALIAAVLAPAVASGAQEPGAQEQGPLPVAPTRSSIDPGLREVEVSSDEFDALAARLDDARARRATAENRLAELAAQEERLASIERRARRTAARAVERRVRIEASLRALAVDAYIRGGPVPAGTALGAGSANARRSRSLMSEILAEDRADALRSALAAEQAAKRRQRRAAAALTAVREEAVEQRAALEVATEEALDLAPRAADARALAVVTGRDLPLVALDAYWRAEQVVALTDPTCGVEWSLLAGIGRVESGHGTFGGSTLSPDGQSRRTIIGIALDGTRGTAVIGDTDGGELDGDPTHDRAVGPMQFIPSTWSRWGRDGNGDGDLDPHNLYDAALGAAAYLCAAGPGLEADGPRDRALFSYNHSQAYVALVGRYAQEYRTLIW